MWLHFKVVWLAAMHEMESLLPYQVEGGWNDRVIRDEQPLHAWFVA